MNFAVAPRKLLTRPRTLLTRRGLLKASALCAPALLLGKSAGAAPGMGFLYGCPPGAAPPYSIADYFSQPATYSQTQFYYLGTLSELWYDAPYGPGWALTTYSYWSANPFAVSITGGLAVQTSTSFYNNTPSSGGWLEYQDVVSSPPNWNSGTAYTAWKAVTVPSGINAGVYYCLVGNTGQAPLAGGTTYWAAGDSYDPANRVTVTCVSGHEFNWGKPGGVVSPYPGTEYQHSNVEFTNTETGTFDVWLNAFYPCFTQTVAPYHTFNNVLAVYNTQAFAPAYVPTTLTWYMAKGIGVIQVSFVTPDAGVVKAGVPI